MLASVLWALLALTGYVMGDWPQAFGTNWLCWRWQTCVATGNWLYIDGGEYYYSNANGFQDSAVNLTFSIDLSQSWTTDTVSPVYITKPSSMALVRRPFMWYDGQADTVFSGGGWPYDKTSTLSLWSFQPDGQGGVNWQVSAGNSQQYTPTFASAFATTNDTFYSLGGADSATVKTAIGGLASFPFSTNSWSNVTSAGASQNSYSVFSEAVFMPNFGEQGLIAFVGGESPSNSTYVYEAGIDLVDMSNITIYDPQTQAWYHQTATGDIPPQRAEFCAVGNAPSDNATFEIFVFGGSTNLTTDGQFLSDTGYTDVYVLSFPAFTWFKTNVAADVRRSNHYCQILSNSNMLVVGGRNPSNDVEGGFSGTDPWTHGMNIFDMVHWAWTGAYNHTAVYTRPQTIQAYYDTNPTKPQWSDPTLASLFATASPPSSSSGSNSTSPNAPNPPSSTPTGAIAGGVVGGVAVLAIIAGVIFFCLARRRKQRRAASGPDSAVALEQPKNPELPASSRRVVEPVYEAPPYSAKERVHEIHTPSKQEQTEMRPVELSADGRQT